MNKRLLLFGLCIFILLISGCTSRNYYVPSMSVGSSSSSDDSLVIGEMYGDNIAKVVVIDAPNTYYEINGSLSSGYNTGFVFIKNSTLQCLIPGMYAISFHVSGETASVSNKEMEGTILFNGVPQSKGTSHAEVSPGGNNRPETISGSLFLNLSTGDNISIGVSNHNDATDFTIEHVSLIALSSLDSDLSISVVNITNELINNITTFVNITNNIINNYSMSINGSVACGGTDKLSNVTLSSNVLSGVCSADQSGGSTPLYWGSFTYNYVLEDDMCGVLTTTGKDWYWTAIASGTTAASTGYPTHPCVRSISSSATASSGGAFNIGILNLLLSGNESTDIIFSKVAKTGNISNVHMGFLDSVTATEPVDGVYVQIHNLTLNGVVRTNNVETNTSTNFNVSADAWYRVRVEIFNTTHAHFYLYNSTTTTGTGNTVLLWSNEINTLLPSATSRQLGNGVTTWVSGSTTAVALMQIDYMNLMINRTLVR